MKCGVARSALPPDAGPKPWSWLLLHVPNPNQLILPPSLLSITNIDFLSIVDMSVRADIEVCINHKCHLIRVHFLVINTPFVVQLKAQNFL